MSAWTIVIPLLLLGYALVWSLCRVASRGSRDEDRIVRRADPRCRELDDGKIALAMGRAEKQAALDFQRARIERHKKLQRGARGLERAEMPHGPDAA